MVSIRPPPLAVSSSIRRSAAIRTMRLLSSTTCFGHVALISDPLETIAPSRSIKTDNKATARRFGARG
jgi:hypothetical protein